MSSGRPDTSSTTTGTPETRSVLIVLRSAESRPMAPGRSPWPSAYGVSPTTATATRYELSMPLPFWLKVTVVDEPTVLRMPCRIDVPGVVLPDPPCQEMVQPPLWLPMLPAFFNTTCDLATAVRASERWAALPSVPVNERSASGRSNSPSSNFLVRMRRLG